MEDKKYTVSVFCSNCDYSGNVSISKGTPVRQRLCPECGCDTLSRKPQSIKPDWWGKGDNVMLCVHPSQCHPVPTEQTSPVKHAGFTPRERVSKLSTLSHVHCAEDRRAKRGKKSS